VRPRSAAELKTFRGLNAKEIERSGEEILKAVNRGLELGKQQHPQEIHYHHRGPQIETHLVNLVQSYVAYLAREHSIANRYLLNAPQIEWLLKNQNESLETWIQMGILSSRAATLIGKELKLFLQGEVGLKIFQGEVKVFNLS
jgi:ribonuclease D